MLEHTLSKIANYAREYIQKKINGSGLTQDSRAVLLKEYIGDLLYFALDDLEKNAKPQLCLRLITIIFSILAVGILLLNIIKLNIIRIVASVVGSVVAIFSLSFILILVEHNNKQNLLKTIKTERQVGDVIDNKVVVTIEYKNKKASFEVNIPPQPEDDMLR
jgi:hypothetical protein